VELYGEVPGAKKKAPLRTLDAGPKGKEGGTGRATTSVVIRPRRAPRNQPLRTSKA